MSEEREHLESLLTHPGWLQVNDWAKREFTDKILSATEAAANERTDTEALGKLRQLIAGKRAVQLLLMWPGERVRQLDTMRDAATKPPRLGRGGA